MNEKGICTKSSEAPVGKRTKQTEYHREIIPSIFDGGIILCILAAQVMEFQALPI